MTTPVCANVTVSGDGWKRPREGSAALPPIFYQQQQHPSLKNSHSVLKQKVKVRSEQGSFH